MPELDASPAALVGDARVLAAIEIVRSGGMVIVVDDHGRENEGDLIMAAEFVTSEDMAFFLRHGSGIVCTPMSVDRADRLGLRLMVDENTDRHGTAFTVTVDHCNVGTGISAPDRAMTVRALADPRSEPTNFRRPGHVFPLVANPGGIQVRPGHTEAATELMTLAQTSGVGAITELVSDDGIPMAGETIDKLAETYDLHVLEIADLIAYRQRTPQLIRRTATATLPTPWGLFQVSSYTSPSDGFEHLALTLGDVATGQASDAGVLVRVHSECLTGDIFSSLRCDCGAQLEQALEHIAAEGTGAIVYLRGHEGRGIGLGQKLQAYALQEQGRDTVDANLDLGLPVDSRDYGIGAEILIDLGIRRIRLLTNNPEKHHGLEGYGVEIVSRVPTVAKITNENLNYLVTKRDRLGHLITLPSAMPHTGI